MDLVRKGGFTRADVLNMTTSDRLGFLELLDEQIRAENAAIKAASKGK